MRHRRTGLACFPVERLWRCSRKCGTVRNRKDVADHAAGGVSACPMRSSGRCRVQATSRFGFSHDNSAYCQVRSAWHGRQCRVLAARRTRLFVALPLVARRPSPTCRARRVVHDPQGPQRAALAQPCRTPRRLRHGASEGGRERFSWPAPHGPPRITTGSSPRHSAGGMSSDIFLWEHPAEARGEACAGELRRRCRLARARRAEPLRSRVDERGRTRRPACGPAHPGQRRGERPVRDEYLCRPLTIRSEKTEYCGRGRARLGAFAREVGRLLAMIHAATADSEDVASPVPRPTAWSGG